ncbi:hypothetical protein [Herbaspirillum sp.]|uniref:hypothetical protein n=1 Tax=Herbaspirillum sp. TaxID=1890675 RepID=UPI001B1054A8|nr:hypothetical protein [Herbaspirillum sp.]MBO9537352.1 hypothetical protein [Herbaspirillum sp.]
MANKSTGKNVASTAARVLGSSSSSAIQRSLAGSVLSQTGNSKVTGKVMEAKASNALLSVKSSSTTKTLAASAISQSRKSR